MSLEHSPSTILTQDNSVTAKVYLCVRDNAPICARDVTQKLSFTYESYVQRVLRKLKKAGHIVQVPLTVTDKRVVYYRATITPEMTNDAKETIVKPPVIEPLTLTAPAPLTPQPDPLAQALSRYEASLATLMTDLKSILSEMADKAIAELLPHVLSDVKSRIDRAITTIAEETEAQCDTLPIRHGKAPTPEASVAERSRMKRFLIIGLLPAQAGNLAADFAETYDLRFWNNAEGDGLRQLRSLAKSSDKILLHVRHLSHAVQNTISAESAKIVCVKGGVAQTRRYLKEEYQQDALESPLNTSSLS